MAKYIAQGGIKGNLQQIISNVEFSSSSKETTSEYIEGYMFLDVIFGFEAIAVSSVQAQSTVSSILLKKSDAVLISNTLVPRNRL